MGERVDPHDHAAEDIWQGIAARCRPGEPAALMLRVRELLNGEIGAEAIVALVAVLGHTLAEATRHAAPDLTMIRAVGLGIAAGWEGANEWLEMQRVANDA